LVDTRVYYMVLIAVYIPKAGGKSGGSPISRTASDPGSVERSESRYPHSPRIQ
jgi:hypothetical protein